MFMEITTGDGEPNLPLYQPPTGGQYGGQIQRPQNSYGQSSNSPWQPQSGHKDPPLVPFSYVEAYPSQQKQNFSFYPVSGQYSSVSYNNGYNSYQPVAPKPSYSYGYGSQSGGPFYQQPAGQSYGQTAEKPAAPQNSYLPPESTQSQIKPYRPYGQSNFVQSDYSYSPNQIPSYGQKNEKPSSSYGQLSDSPKNPAPPPTQDDEKPDSYGSLPPFLTSGYGQDRYSQQAPPTSGPSNPPFADFSGPTGAGPAPENAIPQGANQPPPDGPSKPPFIPDEIPSKPQVQIEGPYSNQQSSYQGYDFPSKPSNSASSSSFSQQNQNSNSQAWQGPYGSSYNPPQESAKPAGYGQPADFSGQQQPPGQFYDQQKPSQDDSNNYGQPPSQSYGQQASQTNGQQSYGYQQSQSSYRQQQLPVAPLLERPSSGYVPNSQPSASYGTKPVSSQSYGQVQSTIYGRPSDSYGPLKPQDGQSYGPSSGGFSYGQPQQPPKEALHDSKPSYGTSSGGYNNYQQSGQSSGGISSSQPQPPKEALNEPLPSYGQSSGSYNNQQSGQSYGQSSGGFSHGQPQQPPKEALNDPKPSYGSSSGGYNYQQSGQPSGGFSFSSSRPQPPKEALNDPLPSYGQSSGSYNNQQTGQSYGQPPAQKETATPVKRPSYDQPSGSYNYQQFIGGPPLKEQASNIQQSSYGQPQGGQWSGQPQQDAPVSSQQTFVGSSYGPSSGGYGQQPSPSAQRHPSSLASFIYGPSPPKNDQPPQPPSYGQLPIAAVEAESKPLADETPDFPPLLLDQQQGVKPSAADQTNSNSIGTTLCNQVIRVSSDRTEVVELNIPSGQCTVRVEASKGRLALQLKNLMLPCEDQTVSVFEAASHLPLSSLCGQVAETPMYLMDASSARLAVNTKGVKFTVTAFLW